LAAIWGQAPATDLSFVNAIVMKDSFQTGMDLIADITRNPAFADEEIARQKDQILSSLRRERRRFGLYRRRRL